MRCTSPLLLSLFLLRFVTGDEGDVVVAVCGGDEYDDKGDEGKMLFVEVRLIVVVAVVAAAGDADGFKLLLLLLLLLFFSKLDVDERSLEDS